MRRKLCFAFCVALLPSAISAAPASWYKWRSKIDGHQVCAQVSPGDGWERLPIAYRDAHCERRVEER